MRQNLRHNLGTIISAVLFTAALWVLYREVQQYHYQDVLQHITALPLPRLWLALALTTLSYLVLSGYDLLAFLDVRHPPPYRTIVLTSFISYALSHSIGFAVLTAGSIRYRFYSVWGLSANEITHVVAFNSLTFWFGFLTLGGLAFLRAPLVLPAAFHLSGASLHPLGAVFLLLVALYVGAILYRRTPFTFRGWEFRFPSPTVAILQILLSCIDWALAGSVLYVLLPASSALSYPHFLGIFLLAQLAGLLSQVPGGLGVFETAMIMLLSPAVPAPVVLAALFTYRGLYYFLPFVLAAILLGAYEVLQRKQGRRVWKDIA
jgi:uncharacterized membrane protein YbhN (UPF0104 family)